MTFTSENEIPISFGQFTLNTSDHYRNENARENIRSHTIAVYNHLPLPSPPPKKKRKVLHRLEGGNYILIIMVRGTCTKQTPNPEGVRLKGQARGYFLYFCHKFARFIST